MISNQRHSLQFACSCLLGALAAAGSVRAAVPGFVHGSIYSSNKATVSAIDSNLSSDLVILEGGLEQGFRRGMVCFVERGVQSVGEIIIIESNSGRAAALILDLTAGFAIQSGDSVRIKTL